MTTLMTLEDVAELTAGDVDMYMSAGPPVTVRKSGDYLERYYQTTPRYNYRGGVTGKFWEKVEEIAAILREAEEWPFPPLAAKQGVLYDGHHRANAALMVGWEKPIPVENSYYSNDANDAYPQDSNISNYEDEDEEW